MLQNTHEYSYSWGVLFLGKEVTLKLLSQQVQEQQ